MRGQASATCTTLLTAWHGPPTRLRISSMAALGYACHWAAPTTSRARWGSISISAARLPLTPRVFDWPTRAWSPWTALRSPSALACCWALFDLSRCLADALCAHGRPNSSDRHPHGLDQLD